MRTNKRSAIPHMFAASFVLLTCFMCCAESIQGQDMGTVKNKDGSTTTTVPDTRYGKYGVKSTTTHLKGTPEEYTTEEFYGDKSSGGCRKSQEVHLSFRERAGGKYEQTTIFHADGWAETVVREDSAGTVILRRETDEKDGKYVKYRETTVDETGKKRISELNKKTGKLELVEPGGGTKEFSGSPWPPTTYVWPETPMSCRTTSSPSDLPAFKPSLLGYDEVMSKKLMENLKTDLERYAPKSSAAVADQASREASKGLIALQDRDPFNIPATTSFAPGKYQGYREYSETACVVKEYHHTPGTSRDNLYLTVAPDGVVMLLSYYKNNTEAGNYFESTKGTMNLAGVHMIGGIHDKSNHYFDVTFTYDPFTKKYTGKGTWSSRDYFCNDSYPVTIVLSPVTAFHD